MKDGEDISSLTTSLEAIIVTLLIDGYEDREVDIFGVPGTFTHYYPTIKLASWYYATSLSTSCVMSTSSIGSM